MSATVVNAIKCGLLLFASTLFALGISEVVVRKLAPQGLAVPWQDEVDGIMAPRPNVHGRHAIPHTFDVTVSFNSQRFRGQRRYELKPAPGVLRIAVLGDSFTFGFGANDDDTYPAQLEALLSGHDGKNRNRFPVEVVNTAVGGTGTGEEALWYDTWVKQYHPQIIILTVVPNDVDDDLGRSLFLMDEKGEISPRPRAQIKQADTLLRSLRGTVNEFPGYSFLAQHSQLFNFLRNRISMMVASRRTKLLENSQQLTRENRFENEGLPLIGKEVAWLNNRSRENGSRLVVVFVPFRESIYPIDVPWAAQTRQNSEAIVGVLHKTCAQEGIPFADLTGYMRDRASQSQQSLYYNGLDAHPNPSGYQTIAEGVAGFLESTGVMQF